MKIVILAFLAVPLFPVGMAALAEDVESGGKQASTTGTKVEPPKFKSMSPVLDTRITPPARLIGRISEVANPEPKSPLLKSQPETGQSRTGRLLQSYPPAWSGLWSGDFVVEQAGGGSKDNAATVLYPGKVGNGKVGFIKSAAGGTTVDPLPIVFFELTEANKRHMNIPLDQQDVRVHVGFGEAHDAVLGSGDIKNSHIVKNVIHLLSNGKSIEQQIVEESRIYSPRTKETFSAARESIFQFSPVSPGVMEVYLAAIEYTKEGRLMSKMMMRGKLQQSKR